MKKPIPFGKYHLLERINVGGMAEVYRAKAYGVEGFERLVAVKRILPNVAEDKEFIKMFVDEAKLAVQLNHANIAQIFDLGMVGSDYYIALEHIHGRDLRVTFERCRDMGEPMPIAQACFCVMKVCEGLDYAHNKRDAAGNELGLVHRDVSPQNVLVSFDGEVKLIDFGIAKAAGRGSQTEAGILKGKFGYMSPEQVRGLPIDRRSDVFACGIVLYEMLTGERLFVGESDFSTLEKVRNVEILPPSTYNRRIPDELERIVLKALAKDVEDRYQNAIDLHDELQAFVYTAGEFYSRKDLAAWMRQTWAKEIQAEKVKLEEYRNYKPASPSAPPAPARQARASSPPPVPGRRPSSRMSVPPPIPGSVQGRRSTLPPPAPAPVPSPGPVAMAASAAPGKLDWDDDELETSIYDNPNETDAISTAKDSPRPLAAAAGAIETAPLPTDRDQDLAGLVQKARDWKPQDGAEELERPVKTATGSGPRISVPAPAPQSVPAPTSLPTPQRRSARGTDLPPLSGEAPSVPPTHVHTTGKSESSAVAALAAMAEQRSTYAGPTMDLMDRPFASRFPATGNKRKLGLVAGAGVLVLGGVVAMALITGGSDSSPQAAESGQPALSPAVLAQTGFDLMVKPSGIKAEVRFDGESKGFAPLRFTNIQPGEHQIEVIAPEGFFNQAQKVMVKAGERPRLVIQLDGVPTPVAITSEPAGASAVLVDGDGARKELGKTPTQAKVDLNRGYHVELSLDGYESETVALAVGQDHVEATLQAVESEPAAEPRRDEVDSRPETADEAVASRHRERHADRPHADAASREDRATEALVKAEVSRRSRPVPQPAASEPEQAPEKRTVVAASGTLLLGSKPPCEIFINGKNTGLKTPQRQIQLSEGKHKVVLVNNQYGIRDTFLVKIEAGKRTKVIRDLTSQMN